MKSILIFLLVISSSVAAQEPDSSSALFQMREAERNFARASVMYGRNASFVENFADESIIFTDKWITNGKQFWKDLKVRPIVLKWEPEYMDIAESRDFGISTGPWEVQEYRPYTAPVATGYFLSVWKKQTDGNWKVILDAGSATPPRTGYDHAFSFPVGADKPVTNPKLVNVELARAELTEREKQFLAEWKTNPLPATYASFLAPDARIQYEVHFPTTNPDTINAWISQMHKTLTWQTVGSGAASSDDLGFTYGLFEMQDNPKGSKGHYVRIWKKQPTSEWTITLEMMSTD
jgi:ketosteroid isomerase-like protein